MKDRFCFGLVALIALSACQGPTRSLTVSLPADLAASGVPISISVSALHQHGIKHQDGIYWAPFEGNTLIPFQYEDHDQDGEADTLFFLVDIEANQHKTITFNIVDSIPPFPAKTTLHLGKKTPEGVVSLDEAPRLPTYDNTLTQATYQFEGPGWENDKVAFRNYLDLRNGIDIFGKTTEAMVLDSVGVHKESNYHLLQNWGMDILKVGSSLGAGSLGIWYQDSLFRLTGEESGYKVLFEGPLRSRFYLFFNQVDLGDKHIDVRHTITIMAGTYAYEAALSIADPTDLIVAIGLVDLHALPAFSLQSGSHQGLYTYGLQSENKDSLGMAVVVPAASYLEAIQTDSVSFTIPNTYALLTSANDTKYRFYAGWEASDTTFKSQQAFQDYLTREMKSWNQPVTIKWLD